MPKGNTTHGLWAETARAMPQLTALQGDHQTDVAIIGGGYTGLSAALHLAKYRIRRCGAQCGPGQRRPVAHAGRSP